jgi:hypothetical protein
VREDQSGSGTVPRHRARQAARQSAEIAQSGVAVQGGRIYIERINAPFVFDLKQRLTGLDCCTTLGFT